MPLNEDEKLGGKVWTLEPMTKKKSLGDFHFSTKYGNKPYLFTGLPFLAQVKVQRLSTCSPDNACGIMSPWPLTQLFGVNASIFPVAIHNMQISYWISIPQNSPLIIMTLIWYCQKPQTSKDIGKQLYIVIANHFIENQTLKMTARFPQNKVNARLHNR